ncbi:hypothetical protein ETB97_000628, partial [Aspergillus alliaceus]
MSEDILDQRIVDWINNIPVNKTAPDSATSVYACSDQDEDSRSVTGNSIANSDSKSDNNIPDLDIPSNTLSMGIRE